MWLWNVLLGTITDSPYRNLLKLCDRLWVIELFFFFNKIFNELQNYPSI